MAYTESETHVSESYNQKAQLYFDHVATEMEHVSLVRAGLRLFAEMVGPEAETLDAGCGPGHIAAFLAANGMNVSGVDISAELIELAKANFPDICFRVGQLAKLPLDNASVQAVVSRHSLIHTEPEHVGEVFSEFSRVLAPKGRLFLSFFAASHADDHGQAFDHAVCTAYQFHPDTISEQLAKQGLTERMRLIRQPHATERQLEHAILFARRSDAV